MHKVCSACAQWLPASEFYANKARPDGLASRCKCCSKALVRLWHLMNPEKSRALRAADRVRNKQQIARLKKAWAQKNREQVHARIAEWRAANQEKVKRYAAKTRARPEHAERERARGAAERSRMTDKYIRDVMGIRATHQLPPELLAAKRLTLAIKRHIKEHK